MLRLILLYVFLFNFALHKLYMEVYNVQYVRLINNINNNLNFLGL